MVYLFSVHLKRKLKVCSLLKYLQKSMRPLLNKEMEYWKKEKKKHWKKRKRGEKKLQKVSHEDRDENL
jgi:hypothetical protein